VGLGSGVGAWGWGVVLGSGAVEWTGVRHNTLFTGLRCGTILLSAIGFGSPCGLQLFGEIAIVVLKYLS
jgi:hypothetical protein